MSNPPNPQPPAAWSDRVEQGTMLIGAIVSVTAPFLGQWFDLPIIVSWAVLTVGLGLLLFALYRGTRVIPQPLARVIFGTGAIVLIGAAIGAGYFSWVIGQPRFEITALNTLDGDPDTYELTDMLIWNRDHLDTYGVATSFKIEIRPRYQGVAHHGQVVAVFTSPDGKERITKPLWDDFTASAESRTVDLTLPEMLTLSGLKTNEGSPTNILQPDRPAFEVAQLYVTVARASDLLQPWPDQKSIRLLNAPWEVRSQLTARDNHRVLDVLVHNLGGPSKFLVSYKLVRLEQDPGLATNLMSSGTTAIALQPPTNEARQLGTGAFFTETLMLPTNLATGRYVIEASAIKAQAYISFTNPAVTWANVARDGTWWWFTRSFEYQIFNVPRQELPLDPVIASEHQRLRDLQIINLGSANGPAEEVVSAKGTVGKRQIFQYGEIYSYDGKAFALYGPILDHYHQRGGYEQKNFGFPTTGIESVASSSGVIATMMKFEGYDNHGNAAIFTSDKGTASVWGKVGTTYFEQEGGPVGWLGIPLADEQYYPASTTELFEQGYIVYLTPMVGNERDWSRPPVAYPYLASRGTLLDVGASEGWKPTGVTVRTGDSVTIIQVSGSWSCMPDGRQLDANGDPTIALQPGSPAPERTIGSLIARLGGDSATILPVGRSAIFTANTDGVLALAMNDTTPTDNQGRITVQIMVQRATP